MDDFARGLLFGPPEQASQPLFQSGHGHAEEKRQNAAGQNGQDQIDKFGGKGQNGRKPQQRNEKRYPYNGHEQILFCFWFHDDIPFPEPAAAKAPLRTLFSYCNGKKQACQDAGKGSGGPQQWRCLPITAFFEGSIYPSCILFFMI